MRNNSGMGNSGSEISQIGKVVCVTKKSQESKFYISVAPIRGTWQQ